MDKLIFLDLETTGLDPKEDKILEVYAQCVNAKTFEKIGEPFHRVIREDAAELRASLNEVVLEMHTRTGLLDVLKDGTPLAEALEALAGYLASHGRAILAGRNVGTFDRRFLEAKRPGITRRLKHQNFDVSTVLNAFKWWTSEDGPTLPETPPMYHRAEVDVLHDIECMGVIADWIENAG